MAIEKTIQKNSKLDEVLIDSLSRSIETGEVIHLNLPHNGILHVERMLPFLVVYRKPVKRDDQGTEKLVKGEASYLISSTERGSRTTLMKALESLISKSSQKFGSFLLVEIWTASNPLSDNSSSTQVRKPRFNIVTPEQQFSGRVIETLERELKRIKLNHRSSDVKLVYQKHSAPKGLSPLLTNKLVESYHCSFIGIEIEPVFRNPDSGEVFPLALRNIHKGFASALKKAFFSFTIRNTTLRPGHHLALGKRALVKSVWEVDKKLAEIDNQFKFLLLVTPVNNQAAWRSFKRSQFQREPRFYYRLRPVDPAESKRELYRIHIESVEDPTLNMLFTQKRAELDRKLTMLSDRNSPAFLYGSLQLYGKIDESLKQEAENILSTIHPRSHESSARIYVNALDFAKMAQAEIEYYRKIYPEVASKVEIRDDIVGLMVSSGNLLVSSRFKAAKSRAPALIQHEVGTHILTYYNGKSQPFRLLSCGLAGYDELQEGLAVLSEYLVGGLSRPRLRKLAGRVVGADMMVEGATFIEVFRSLNKDYGFEQRLAFTMTSRLFRGGGLTKDAIYLRGLIKVLDYLGNSGKLPPLLVGKIAADHIPIINELLLRKVIHLAPLTPSYFNSSSTEEKIKFLRTGVKVLDLIKKRKK